MNRYSPLKRTGFKRKEGKYGLKRTGKPWKREKPKAMKSRPRTLYAGTMWSRDVKERDDYTCQRCGVRDEKNNHAHHVAPRSRRPDLKFDRSNGKTLCPGCHRWVHENPIESTALGLLSDATYETRGAARAYDAAAIKLHGEFACLNFPRKES